MRGQYILDLMYMKIIKIEKVFCTDEHKGLYVNSIKFVGSPVLRLENDHYLCGVETYAVIDGNKVRILDINPATNTINVVRLTDKVRLDYNVENLKILGFTLDYEPILEYNIL